MNMSLAQNGYEQEDELTASSVRQSKEIYRHVARALEGGYRGVIRGSGYIEKVETTRAGSGRGPARLTPVSIGEITGPKAGATSARAQKIGPEPPPHRMVIEPPHLEHVADWISRVGVLPRGPEKYSGHWSELPAVKAPSGRSSFGQRPVDAASRLPAGADSPEVSMFNPQSDPTYKEREKEGHGKIDHGFKSLRSKEGTTMSEQTDGPAEATSDDSLSNHALKEAIDLLTHKLNEAIQAWESARKQDAAVWSAHAGEIESLREELRGVRSQFAEMSMKNQSIEGSVDRLSVSIDNYSMATKGFDERIGFVMSAVDSNIQSNTAAIEGLKSTMESLNSALQKQIDSANSHIEAIWTNTESNVNALNESTNRRMEAFEGRMAQLAENLNGMHSSFTKEFGEVAKSHRRDLLAFVATAGGLIAITMVIALNN